MPKKSIGPKEVKGRRPQYGLRSQKAPLLLSSLDLSLRKPNHTIRAQRDGSLCSLLSSFLRNKEHNPPHIHAVTQDFGISSIIVAGGITAGEFPSEAKAMVKEFILKYQNKPTQTLEAEKYVTPSAGLKHMRRQE